MPLQRRRGIVYLVTDRRRLRPRGSPDDQRRALIEQACAAAAAAVDLLQLRERDLPAGALRELAAEIVEAVAASSLRVLVNDRLDVAISAGAHGVHLPSSGISVQSARALAPPGFVIGHSIHGGEQPDADADFAVFGTVFPSHSKGFSQPAAGIGALEAAARRARVPVLAIGGLTADTVGEVAPLCAGVAAIGWFATTDLRKMATAVARVRSAFDSTAPLNLD